MAAVISSARSYAGSGSDSAQRSGLARDPVCSSFTTCWTFRTEAATLGNIPALGLRSDLAGQRDDPGLDRILHSIGQLVLNERGVQVCFDTLVQILIHGLGIALGAQREHHNLVGHNFSTGERPC